MKYIELNVPNDWLIWLELFKNTHAHPASDRAQKKV